MAHILDVRNSEGQLVLLGGAFGLPTSNYSVSTPTNGSLRWNVGSEVIEYYKDGTWYSISQTTAPYDMYGTYIGVPSGSLLWQIVLARTVTLPAGLTGSAALCTSASTADITLPIKRNGSTIGTINFAASSVVGTFTFSSQVVFAHGDLLQVYGPSPSNSSFSSPSWSLAGTR